MQKAVIQQKAQAVEVLTDKLKRAKTVVVFDYQGLSVLGFTQLRTQLREAGSEVTVYKNNITRRASIAAGYEALADQLVGAKALAISYDDVVAPAKIVNDFAKDYKVVDMKAGIIDGKVSDAAELKVLATLPSRETLLTMLAVGLLQPVKELAIGLNMIAEEKE